MYNLFNIFDDEMKEVLKKYNINIENKKIDEDEYTNFLKLTNKMGIEDMERIYDYLDDYFIKNKEIMNDDLLNKYVVVVQKNGKLIQGIILYWVQEQGEREYILINSECIYIDDIKEIKLSGDDNDWC